MIERNKKDQVSEEAHYKLLRLLEQGHELSQREIAERLGVSLGKANYCLQALIEKGWIKVGNFYRSSNKRAYLYLLTPSGASEKAKMALRFLRRKELEHKAIIREIELLRAETERDRVKNKVGT